MSYRHAEEETSFAREEEQIPDCDVCVLRNHRELVRVALRQHAKTRFRTSETVRFYPDRVRAPVEDYCPVSHDPAGGSIKIRYEPCMRSRWLEHAGREGPFLTRNQPGTFVSYSLSRFGDLVAQQRFYPTEAIYQLNELVSVLPAIFSSSGRRQPEIFEQFLVALSK